VSDVIPPKPKRPPGKSSKLQMIRLGVRSSLAVFYDESFGVDIGRTWIPTLPALKKRWMFTVREPELAREVLVRRAGDFHKSDIMDPMLQDVTGDSLFTSDGETWRRQRKLMDPAFAQAGLKAVFPLMRQAGDAAIARLADHVATRPDDALNVDAVTTHFAADIIFRTIFSESISAADAQTVFAAFEVFQKVSYAQGMLQMARAPARLVPGAGAAKRAARKIRAILKGPLDRRLKALKAGEPCPTADILAVLASTTDPDTGDALGESELLDQIAFLFLAGHETSASALAWALYLLAIDPGTQASLYAEVAEQVGDKTIEFAHIKRLAKVRDAFRETLRLYPPVAFFARDAMTDMRLGGRDIEKGSIVVVAPWLLHRQPRHWGETPDAFDPSRFDTAQGQEGLRCAYMPFSMGERVCVGAAFALQEATLLLAEVVRRFELSPQQGHTPEPVARLTLRSANGVRVRIKAR
jgi:cytochrome P450